MRNCFLVVCILATSVASAQDAAPLTDAEQEAMQSINERSVLGTVSFLSSDEMAGRDTPSRELTIASAYVAARLRGAGLEGLGPEGSFYQTHTIQTTQPPRNPARLTAEDGAVTNLLVVTGSDEDLEVSGRVLSAKEAQSSDKPAIAIMPEIRVPPQVAGNPAYLLAMAASDVRSLAEKGVKVVLVEYSDESVLPEMAERLLDKALMPRRGMTPACSVVLVPQSMNLAGQSVQLSVDAQRTVDEPVHNVLGILRGSDPQLSQEAIIISAHLDHIGMSSAGADPINNGADDNATGVTAVVSMADAFTALKARPARSVIFCTFWGEEKGLVGSSRFVEKPLWPLEKIAANINIEMVGRPEKDAREKAWMTGWVHSNLGAVMNAGAKRAGVEIFHREDVSEMLYKRSDNYPFVNAGVIAHSFSAGSLHGDYHQPSDEWQKLDIPHMTKVIKGLFAGSLHVAQGAMVEKRK